MSTNLFKKKKKEKADTYIDLLPKLQTLKKKKKKKKKERKDRRQEAGSKLDNEELVPLALDEETEDGPISPTRTRTRGNGSKRSVNSSENFGSFSTLLKDSLAGTLLR